MSEEVIKAYKGFNKDMTCRGFHFEEGKEYETDGAEVCEKGFHACEMPLDVFKYYPPATSIYHEVEQSGEISKADDDTKVASSKIKICAELSIAALCELHSDLVKSKCKSKINAGKYGAATAGKYGAATAGYGGAATAGNYGDATAGNGGAATAGNCGAATAGERGAATAGCGGAATAGYGGAATAGYGGAATAGDYGAATAGKCGAATAGERGAATAGYGGAATAGNYGAATAGNGGAATAGNCGAATAGKCGAATAGNYGAATGRGKASGGANSIISVRGNAVKAKGGIGSVIVIAKENEYNYNLKEWKAGVVDGETLKADTWYKLENGEFVEADEEGEQK